MYKKRVSASVSQCHHCNAIRCIITADAVDTMDLLHCHDNVTARVDCNPCRDPEWSAMAGASTVVNSKGRSCRASTSFCPQRFQPS
ncbi:hypothetical protein VTN02DRAFT_4981 [Thermoascus thermophilus]